MAETAPRTHGASASFNNYDKQMALTHGSESNVWGIFKKLPFWCHIVLLNNFSYSHNKFRYFNILLKNFGNSW